MKKEKVIKFVKNHVPEILIGGAALTGLAACAYVAIKIRIAEDTYFVASADYHVRDVPGEILEGLPMPDWATENTPFTATLEFFREE